MVLYEVSLDDLPPTERDSQPGTEHGSIPRILKPLGLKKVYEGVRRRLY